MIDPPGLTEKIQRHLLYELTEFRYDNEYEWSAKYSAFDRNFSGDFMTNINTPRLAGCIIVLAMLTAIVEVAATGSPLHLPSGVMTTEAETNPPRIASSSEQNFLEENASSMAAMMRAMHSQPTGDIDRDFVQQMIPHHQGAIDMAKSLLKAGHNERLKRLAQEIIITQQEEIETMRLLVPEPESADNPERPPTRQR